MAHFSLKLKVFTTLCMILFQPSAFSAEPVDYRVFMYKNGESTTPSSVFSPHDKIVIFMQFLQLPDGEYSFHADWYNSFGELQDASRHDFFIEKTMNYAVESWLEIRKAGFFTRLFSVSETTGFHVKFYGKWQVKLYLNGEELAIRSFEVK